MSIILISIPLSLAANELLRLRRQRTAIREVERAGGFCFLDFEVDDGAPLGDSTPSTSFLLRTLFGDDAFAYVAAVGLNAKNADVTLASIDGMPRIKHLWLHDTDVTNRGMVHLRGLTKLETLWLMRTQIGTSGLGNIKGLTELRALRLDDTRISDGGLSQLQDLPSLTELDISRTQVTDVGLVHLERLKNLKFLNLEKCDVTDEGVDRLQAALPSCVITGP